MLCVGKVRFCGHAHTRTHNILTPWDLGSPRQEERATIWFNPSSVSVYLQDDHLPHCYLLLSSSTVSSPDPLESRLQSPISDAKCLAACVRLPSPGSQAQCHQVCRFRQQHPDTDLCRVPGLCVELGCQVACQDITLLPHTGKFTSFTRSGCLSWNVGGG